MTKKTVTLILIVTIFFSVIAMAVWGKVPETSKEVAVEGLVFRDANGKEITEINDSEEKEKKITLQTDTKNTLTYRFSVELIPSDATDLGLEYIVEYGDITINELERTSSYVPNEDEEEGEVDHNNIYNFEITFNKQALTNLSFTANFSGTRRVKDYLMFAFEGSAYEDDIII